MGKASGGIEELRLDGVIMEMGMGMEMALIEWHRR